MTEQKKLNPPRAFSELKPWLQEHYLILPKRLQSVAMFAMHNPDVIALNTAAVISEKAKVTPSTLVRFAQSIGYKGFSDLQNVFQESMRHMPQAYSERLHYLEQPDLKQTVLHRFTQAAKASIARLDQQADENAIKQASKQIAEARTIYLVGQGRAEPVIAYLQYTLVKLGMQTVTINGMHSVMTEKARLIRQEEILLAISFSPYTANTREIVDVCLEQGTKVIALTDSSLSPIAISDDPHLEVLEEEVSGFRGLSATMCLALCLAVEAGKWHKKLI